MKLIGTICTYSLLFCHRYIEIFPSRRNEVRTHVGSHKGKKIASSPTAKYITEPEVVFEEHEVNEDIRPMTAFESEKEIGKACLLLKFIGPALYVLIFVKKKTFMTMLYDTNNIG